MIVDLFRKDWRKMTAQGVKFTPDDIVRLNALAVKVKRSATAAREICLPRVAFMPRDSRWRQPIILREPTLAHDLWLEAVGRYINGSDEAFLFLHSYALSRKPQKLTDPAQIKKTVNAVYTFAAKRLARFTRDQLQSAVEYVLLGDDWTTGETAPAKTGEKSANASTTIGIITEARVMRLPITLDDALRMTASEMVEAINRARAEEEKLDPQQLRQQALRDYIRTREEIRGRQHD